MEIEGFIYYFLVYKQRHPVMLLFTAYKRLLFTIKTKNTKQKILNQFLQTNTNKGENEFFPFLLPSFITQIQRILILCHP